MEENEFIIETEYGDFVALFQYYPCTRQIVSWGKEFPVICVCSTITDCKKELIYQLEILLDLEIKKLVA